MSSVDIETEEIGDDFEDACSNVEPLDYKTNPISLNQALEESQRAIDLFFNNKFHEAKQLTEPLRKVSMYHAAGYGVFNFLEAILTFDPEAIARASAALKSYNALCNEVRKKNSLAESLGSIVHKANYDQYTEEEAHAELCRAECLLLRASLTFIEDETLSGFIKAGLKIKTCFNSYKHCQMILENKRWDGCDTKLHFESGVKMGIGAFNLMISMLPGRVVKLLEFIGFSGNKQVGLKELHEGLHMKGIRQILCVMTLLGYNLFVLSLFHHKEGDLEICEKILNVQLAKHPEGAWFLFFKGRLEFMKCNLDTSSEWYIRAWKSQSAWPQFHHMCFWELMWLHSLKLDWKQAQVYTGYLVEHSRWSRTIYSYQKAALMCMTTLTADERAEVDALMKDVPKYKQRIAGKSLPMEKFAVKKAERYFSQDRTLVLPVVELMYIWNMFKIFKRKFSVAENMYKLIEKAQSGMKDTTSDKYYYDNMALISLLKGACLRQMDSPLQALECLEYTISLKKLICDDHYLIPYAIVELALWEWENGNSEKALLALEDAKRNYTGYGLESRLHFKIHTALMDFKPSEKNHR